MCSYFDEAQKKKDIFYVKSYCGQFEKIPVIFSQKFEPSQLDVGSGVRIKFNRCETKFSCVIKKGEGEDEKIHSATILGIKIDDQGTIVSHEIIESSGSPHIDKKAVSVAEKMKFDTKQFPLGDAFKQKFIIKIDKENFKQVR